MFYGVVSTYNQATNLEATLRDLLLFCDSVVVVDGCYDGFPPFRGSKYSVDGTAELCRRLGEDHKISYVLQSGSESAKRTACYVGEVGDWYLRLDDDELLLCEGELDPAEVHRISSVFHRCISGSVVDWYLFPILQGNGKVRKVARLFRHVAGMRHLGVNDDVMVDAENNLYCLHGESLGLLGGYPDYPYQYAEISTVPILHRLGVRSADYISRKTVMHASRTGNKLGDKFIFE